MAFRNPERTAVGGVWIDETYLPIYGMKLVNGLIEFSVDATKTWDTLQKGETVYRIVDPDGKPVAIGKQHLPELDLRGCDTITISLTMRIVGSRPGETWWHTDVT